MKPPSFLTTLSSEIPARLLSSPADTPLPTGSQFDRILTRELDTLLIQGVSGSGYTSTAWIVDALGTSTIAQKIAVECLGSIRYGVGDDRLAIDQYLDDNAELLDACRELSATMSMIRDYVELLKLALHSLHGMFLPSATALSRASRMLLSCGTAQVEMKSWFLWRKSRLKTETNSPTELSEILRGSSAVASMAFQVLGMAFFVGQRRFFPAMQSRPVAATWSWSCSLQEIHKGVQEALKRNRKCGRFVMLSELEETTVLAQQLRIHINCGKYDKMDFLVEQLRRKYEVLEEERVTLERKVDELYKHLISLRMALLGILSRI